MRESLGLKTLSPHHCAVYLGALLIGELHAKDAAGMRPAHWQRLPDKPLKLQPRSLHRAGRRCYPDSAAPLNSNIPTLSLPPRARILRAFMRKPTIALLALVVIVCVAASASMWRRAFPLAGLDFRVSRNEARVQLEKFIGELGHPLGEYRNAITFDEDDDTKRFIEIEHGLPRLESLTRQGLNVWYWTVRWFRPSQHEEFSANLDPQGWLVGFQHTIEEERERPSLELPAARILAEDFLRRHAAHHPFERLAFLEESHEQRPKRTDWWLTWERTDLRLGEARYRIMVTVKGDAIGAYSEGLEVPEAWTRRFAEKRAVNELCQSLAQYAMMPLGVGAFVLLVVYLRRRQLDRRALPWGWLAVFAAVQLGNEINGLPELFFNYRTTEEWGAFVSKSALSAFQSVLFAPFGFWLLAILADAIYREQLPEHPPFRRALGAGAWRDPHTRRALGLGIVLAAVAMAYVPGFYLVAQRLGAWCPVDVEYTEMLSGALPWVGAMSTGLSAAFTEELFFRVIGMLLIVKLLRWRWLAVLIACSTWAFLHSNYAQMPGYLRGIELSIEGMLWGWVVLRFGIVATLTAHYLLNTWLGCLFVLQSPSWMDRGGALAASLWPVALFAWACWADTRAPLEQSDAAHEQPAVAPVTPATALPRRWDFTPARFTAKRWWILCGTSFAAMVALYFTPSPLGPVHELGSIDLSRTQIALKADAVLRERGFSPETFRRVITIHAQSTEARYLLGFGTLAEYAELLEKEWPDVSWHVRYFRIGEREEIGVFLDKHGALVRWDHSIPREAPGASLDREAALALAREAMPPGTRSETMVSESVTEQVNRRDHYFEFKREDWKWGESELRSSIQVQGDEAVGFWRWVKLPEADLRAHAKSGWRQFLAQQVGEWTSLALGIGIGCIFVVLVRRHLVPWRQGFALALFPLALSLIDSANSAPWFFHGYNTTTPLANFLIRRLLGGALGFAGGYLGNVLKIGVALGLAAWAFGWTPRAFAHAIAADSRPRRFWRDALPPVLVTMVVLWAETEVKSSIAGHWLPWREIGFPLAAVSRAWPWLGALVYAFQRGTDEMLTVAMSASLVALCLRRAPRLTIAVLVLLPIVRALDSDAVDVFAYDVFSGELSLAVQVLLVIFVWRFNPLAVFFSYAASSLLGAIFLFTLKGGPVYRWDGAALIAIVFFAAIFVFGKSRAGKDAAVIPES